MLLSLASIFLVFSNILLYIHKYLFKPRYFFEFDLVDVIHAPELAGVAFVVGNGISIGVGCAVTTRGILVDRPKDLYKDYAQLAISDKSMSHLLQHPNVIEFIQHLKQTLPLFSDLLPSFCRTVSKPFTYKLFVAYDYNDPILSTRYGQQSFKYLFHNIQVSTCPKNMTMSLQLIRCSHTHQPARAQNDAMIAAYKDNMDYLYRVNDDTLLATPYWTEAFIQTLLNYDPPNVGVVGPSTNAKHYENNYILTYEFVHRTHIDIFGYYYPSLLTTWYADDWITHVYQPGRSVRLSDILIQHTELLGRRYELGEDVLPKLDQQLVKDKHTLQKWLQSRWNVTNRVTDD